MNTIMKGKKPGKRERKKDKEPAIVWVIVKNVNQKTRARQLEQRAKAIARNKGCKNSTIIIWVHEKNNPPSKYFCKIYFQDLLRV